MPFTRTPRVYHRGLFRWLAPRARWTPGHNLWSFPTSCCPSCATLSRLETSKRAGPSWPILGLRCDNIESKYALSVELVSVTAIPAPVCTLLHIHMRVCVCTCVCAHENVCMCARLQKYSMLACIQIYKYTHIHAYIYTYTCVRVCIHPDMHADIYAHMYTHASVCTVYTYLPIHISVNAWTRGMWRYMYIYIHRYASIVFAVVAGHLRSTVKGRRACGSLVWKMNN